MITRPYFQVVKSPEAPWKVTTPKTEVPSRPVGYNFSKEHEEIFDPIAPLSLDTYEKLNRIAECELYRENLLPVKIAGKPFSVILDTGADRTVISKEFYETLCKLTPLKLTPAANKPSFTAGTQSIMPLGFLSNPHDHSRSTAVCQG